MVLIRLQILALLAALVLGASAGVAAAELKTVPTQAAGAPALAFDGAVEALRQTVIAAQVPGAVVQLEVKAGDRVQAGQLLLRLDARAADQNVLASDAQVLSARALLDAATRELERQKQLFQQNYISRAALDRAESDFRTTQAQVAAQGAQAGGARTQTSFYVVRAPYAGVVSEVPVMLGDMAMPGKPLVTLYDPAALRISAAVPQTLAPPAGAAIRAELPGLPAARQWPTPARVQVLPTADAATHTVQVRADLPAGIEGVTPGMFARLWLPAAAGGTHLTVPLSAVVRRAEMTGLYVLDAGGRPLLRQVRLGRTEGDRVEVLSGLSAGERVVSDPQAAGRVR